MFKKFIYLFVASASLFGMQSCTKCGHCVTTQTVSTGSGSSIVTKNEWDTVCDEEDVKAEKINCDRWAVESLEEIDPDLRQYYTFSSSWVDDK